jgi:hypothetical protein
MFFLMEWHGLLLGAVGGLLGTLVMSAIEVMPWKKWRLAGIYTSPGNPASSTTGNSIWFFSVDHYIDTNS